MPRKRVPSFEELKLIKEMNEKHYSYIDISKKLNCNTKTLKRIMKEYNIKKQITSRKNHELKENFFESIDTEEKAYIIGLLKTDGFIKQNPNHTPRWGIQLKESDKEILETMLKIVNSDSSLVLDKRENKRAYSFEISNQRMCDDLAKYEIVPQKTYLLKDIHIEQIPQHLQKHYLRGLLDGDGSIYIETKYEQVAITFTGYNKSFVQSFQDAIDKAINKTNHSNIQKANAWFCRWKGNILTKNILEYLYRDATIYLPRKQKFYLNMINR